MTDGYRVWPALLVAGLGLVGATAVMASAVGTDAGPGCAVGQDWVAVTPWDAPVPEEGTVMANYGQQVQPLFRACVDVSELPVPDPAEVPDPRS